MIRGVKLRSNQMDISSLGIPTEEIAPKDSRIFFGICRTCFLQNLAPVAADGFAAYSPFPCAATWWREPHLEQVSMMLEPSVSPGSRSVRALISSIV